MAINLNIDDTDRFRLRGETRGVYPLVESEYTIYLHIRLHGYKVHMYAVVTKWRKPRALDTPVSSNQYL